MLINNYIIPERIEGSSPIIDKQRRSDGAILLHGRNKIAS